MYIDLLSINKKIKTTSSKKPKALLLAFCFFAFYFKGQVNYVPNPSFENVIGYDNTFYINDISVAVPWDSLKAGGGGGGIMSNPTASSIPILGYQLPRTGNFMAGVHNYVVAPVALRSYIQSKLIKKLKANKSYCVTHFVNLLNRSKYSIDELSAYFDDGSISSILPGREAVVSAQIKSPTGIYYFDTLNWMKVQGTFISNGTEDFITLGNFKSYAAATFSLVYPSSFADVAEYYIDDVSVIEADLPAYAGRDTVLCTGDSVFIGRPPEIGLECLWFNNGSQIAIGGGIWVKPATSQTYAVSQDVCGLIKKDTIQVQIKPKYLGTQTLTANTFSACLQDTVRLTLLNPPPGNAKYDWLPTIAFTNTSNLIAKALIQQNTTFTLTTNSDGAPSFCPLRRTNTVTVIVPQYTDTPIIVTNSVNVCPSDTIKFNVQNAPSGNAIKYQWLPMSAFTNTSNLSAKALIHQTTGFTLNINNNTKNIYCPFTRTVNVYVNVSDSCFKDPQIPNIFTPNNDYVNDLWQINFPFGYSLQELNIYNRWGTLIYTRNNLSFTTQSLTLIGWDGRTTSGEECTAGVYFFVLKYVDKSGIVKINKANITLLK